STKITFSIPRDNASIPKAPLPANKSNPIPDTSCRLLKIPSLTLSIVGRVLRPSILSNGLLLWIPEITLIEKHFHSLSYFYIIHTAGKEGQSETSIYTIGRRPYRLI